MTTDPRLVGGQPDTRSDSALVRLARAVAAFRDMPAEAYVAAVATADGGVTGVTYGDLSDLVRDIAESHSRLDRIVNWHARETGPAGTVGDYCTECGTRWPCDTRRMAEGTYTDDEEEPRG